VPVFRRVPWLRLVVGTGGAVSILPARKIRLSGRLHRRSATVSEAQDRSVFAVGSFVCQPALVGHVSARLPNERGTNCLLAAQLGAAPDRAPLLGPAAEPPRAFWMACVSELGTLWRPAG